MEAVLDPVISPLFTGGGSIRTRIGGRMSEFSSGNAVEADTELFVKVPSFEKLFSKACGYGLGCSGASSCSHGLGRIRKRRDAPIFETGSFRRTSIRDSNQRLKL